MRKQLICTTAAALLAGCAETPPPVMFVCDREAQAFDKFGTPEDGCAESAIAAAVPLLFIDDGDGTDSDRLRPESNPDDPDEKDDEDEDAPEDDPDDPDGEDGPDEDPDHDDKGLGNPGNGKPVGRSPFDGITGNSGNNDAGRGSPKARPMNGQRDDRGPQPGGGDGPSE